MTDRTCSVDGCERPYFVKGYCKTHYSRVWKYGTTELPPRKPRPPREPKPKVTCSVEGCEREADGSRGWCTMHYRRWRKSGTTGSPFGPASARFWPKVNKNGPIAKNDPALGPCWVWIGNFGTTVYGLFWSGERMMNSHKFAYELLVGPVPDGLELDHFACDNPPCCNPAHLKPVTRLENLRRVVDARTHCKHGHPFDEVNTYWRPGRGGRDCRTCRRAALARRDAKRKGAA